LYACGFLFNDYSKTSQNIGSFGLQVNSIIIISIFNIFQQINIEKQYISYFQENTQANTEQNLSTLPKTKIYPPEHYARTIDSNHSQHHLTTQVGNRQKSAVAKFLWFMRGIGNWPKRQVSFLEGEHIQ